MRTPTRANVRSPMRLKRAYSHFRSICLQHAVEIDNCQKFVLNSMHLTEKKTGKMFENSEQCLICKASYYVHRFLIASCVYLVHRVFCSIEHWKSYTKKTIYKKKVFSHDSHSLSIVRSLMRLKRAYSGFPPICQQHEVELDDNQKFVL